MVNNRTVNIVAMGLVATILLCIAALTGLAVYDVEVPEVLAYTTSTAIGSLASLLAFARIPVEKGHATPAGDVRQSAPVI